MLSPCCEEVGDMSAPVGRNSTLHSLPASISGNSLAHTTEPAQPQPDPSGVNILLLPVIDEQAAVLVVLSNQDAAFPQKLFHQLAANPASKSPVKIKPVIFGSSFGVLQVIRQGLGGGRRHGRSHIVGIRHA